MGPVRRFFPSYLPKLFEGCEAVSKMMRTQLPGR